MTPLLVTSLNTGKVSGMLTRPHELSRLQFV